MPYPNAFRYVLFGTTFLGIPAILGQIAPSAGTIMTRNCCPYLSTPRYSEGTPSVDLLAAVNATALSFGSGLDTFPALSLSNTLIRLLVERTTIRLGFRSVS